MCCTRKILLIVFIVKTTSAALPSSIRTCSKKLPTRDRELCWKSAFEDLALSLKTGDIQPGLKVDSLDPLLLGDVAFGNGFLVKLKNFQFYGMSKFKVDKIQMSPDDTNVKITALLHVPKATSKANYNMDWNIGILNLRGSGKTMAEYDNIKILLQLIGTRISVQNIEYIKITNVKIKFKIGALKMRFENLFSGNKALEDVANEVINQNSDLVIKDAIPIIEQNFSEKVLKASNQFFALHPADEIFPRN